MFSQHTAVKNITSIVRVSTAMLFIILLIQVSSVYAGGFRLSGVIDASDPLGSIPSFTGSSCSGSITARYDIQIFHVDTTGTYTLDITLGTLGDSVMMLYSPSFSPSLPSQNCLLVDDDGGSGLASRITTTLTENTTYVVLVRGFSGATGSYTLDITGPGTIFRGNGPERLPAFTDGRINDFDVAAPIAVYPHVVNEETGLIIYDNQGVEMLVVSAQQIADAPENPDSNILIAGANGVTLYRIEGGFWQINAPQYNGKTYVLIFQDMFHGGGYESFELEG